MENAWGEGGSLFGAEKWYKWYDQIYFLKARKMIEFRRIKLR